jgi:hypothetical protein
MDLMSLAPPALFPLKFLQNGAMLVPFILRPEISLLLGLLGRHKLSQNFVLHILTQRCSGHIQAGLSLKSPSVMLQIQPLKKYVHGSRLAQVV